MSSDYSIDECILVLNLYRALKRKGTKSFSEKDLDVVELATKITGSGFAKRSPKSIRNKLHNFEYLDTGSKGLANGGNATRIVWNLYKNETDRILESDAESVMERIEYLASSDFTEYAGEVGFESGRVLEHAMRTPAVGYDKEYLGWVRVNQDVFRCRVLNNFDNKCCITGMGGSSILRASHIKPWCKCHESEKIDTGNGLCLNPLLDIMFDRGHMTLDDNYRVCYCSFIENVVNDCTYEHEIRPYEGRRISRSVEPVNQKYLDYHRRIVFAD